MDNISPKRLPAETIILGFTGSLGSGCTYVSEEVARLQQFWHYELSTPIRERAKREGDESYLNKQKIGNELRQEKHGPAELAVHAMMAADMAWGQNLNEFKGVIFSGIRNLGEVRHLRQFPNFFLFSIHADTDMRFNRLQRTGRIADRAQFDLIDEHDSEEEFSHGQQVKRCNYEADVIFNNSEDIPATAPNRKEQYVRDRFIQKYVSLIQRLIAREDTHENLPSADEAFMTMAYCESSRSACLKRKVGAVIAQVNRCESTQREYGVVISSGHNEVPQGQDPCVFAPNLLRCYRDKLQEDFARKLAHCPSCGTVIDKAFVCRSCHKDLSEFFKICPHCGSDPGIEYRCRSPECQGKEDLYSVFVPGSGSKKGKLLDVCRSLHAEENAILGLARNGGLLTENAVLYTTTFPCNLCANKIAEVGIKKIIYAEPYPMPEAIETLRKRAVQVQKFEGVKSSAFFRLYP